MIFAPVNVAVAFSFKPTIDQGIVQPIQRNSKSTYLGENLCRSSFVKSPNFEVIFDTVALKAQTMLLKNPVPWLSYILINHFK